MAAWGWRVSNGAVRRIRKLAKWPAGSRKVRPGGVDASGVHGADGLTSTPRERFES
jgi:hypothetical protein